MKAGVLYSGGKDSSFMAVMLKRLGLDVELCTANFGVYDSYIPAGKSAESLGFTHKVLDMDFEIHLQKMLADPMVNFRQTVMS